MLKSKHFNCDANSVGCDQPRFQSFRPDVARLERQCSALPQVNNNDEVGCRSGSSVKLTRRDGLKVTGGQYRIERLSAPSTSKLSQSREEAERSARTR